MRMFLVYQDVGNDPSYEPMLAVFSTLEKAQDWIAGLDHPSKYHVETETLDEPNKRNDWRKA